MSVTITHDDYSTRPIYVMGVYPPDEDSEFDMQAWVLELLRRGRTVTVCITAGTPAGISRWPWRKR